MNDPPFAFRVLLWFAAGFAIGLVLSESFLTPDTPRLAATRAAVEPQAASFGHRFTSDAGIVLKFIKQDRVGDFEATIERLRDALSRSADPKRRAQAHSWRVYKAFEPATNGDAVYVFEINPPVTGADYTVGRILAEAFPAEAESLYRRYANASSLRQHVIDLKLVAVMEDPR